MGNEDDPFNRFKSCKKSADPCKESDDPCKESDNPCKESDDPCKESNDPCKESDDPCKESGDPCKESGDPCKESDDPCKQSYDSCEKSPEIDPCELDSGSQNNTCTSYPDTAKPKQSPCQSADKTVKRPSIPFFSKKKSADTAIPKDLVEGEKFKQKLKTFKTHIPTALKPEEDTEQSSCQSPDKTGKKPSIPFFGKKKSADTAIPKDLVEGEKFKQKLKTFKTHIPSALKPEETTKKDKESTASAPEAEGKCKKSGSKLQESIKKCGIMQKLGPNPKIMIQNGFAELKKFFKQQQMGGSTPPGKKMADKAPGAPARPMKFPYTFTAKIAQFPLGHYIKNQWIWRYYLISVGLCFPVFYSINKLANSPANVAKWAEIRRKEAAEHH